MGESKMTIANTVESISAVRRALTHTRDHLDSIDPKWRAAFSEAAAGLHSCLAALDEELALRHLHHSEDRS